MKLRVALCCAVLSGLCATDAGSRARLFADASVITIEPDTALAFERGPRLRVRLFFGRLLVDGPAVVTSAAGVVDVRSGSGVVELTGNTLRVACASGEWRVDDPSGERVLAVGESTALQIGLAAR